ncbi:MAG: potassium transporter Kup, partial [Alphaproteobacteria bacterium]|nr:potassium transporter Kup [Alphaproteobacteria bacterium]
MTQRSDAGPAPGGDGTHVHAHHGSERTRGGLVGLIIGSIGVVYGDIGTSPLYALRESLAHQVEHDALTEESVVGAISLLIFALIFTVTIKYVIFVMRADNRGEGGILSLMALAQTAMGRRTRVAFLLGVGGAALFAGEAIITPAISVMSAIEGLELVTHRFSEFVLPITIFILVTLFWVQSHGTARVAALFGPIMIVFFLTIGVLGAMHIPEAPQVLRSFDPRQGMTFLVTHGWLGFVVLGSVFLAVTGVEALYADMGHFGRGPIRAAWLGFVLPALLLNYLGQGALVLSRPEAVGNPFFLLAPEWGLLPLVILSTLATTIAAQAVITGAFSLARQAIQLGLIPRLEVTHTSA